MTSQIHTAARTILAAVVLSVATFSLPAVAGGFGDESLIIKKQEYKCQGIERAARALKNWNYRNVEFEGKAKDEYVYIFSADKKRNGEFYSWYVFYDACDREITYRELANKEEEKQEKM